MKFKILLNGDNFFTGLSSIDLAKDELKMHKEALDWMSLKGIAICNEIVEIDSGQNVPDMRSEFCGQQ